MNKENFDYLKTQHARYLNHLDILNRKITQTIAANIIVMSFVFDKMKNAHATFLYASGLTLILVSLGLCVFAYRTKEVCDSPKISAYHKKDDEIKKILIEELSDDIVENKKIQEQKANLFDISLFILFLGMIVLMVGYYV